MADSSSSSSGGLGFFGALFLVFLVLKLTDNIDWPWWWVSAPLWIPPVVLIAGLVVAVPVITMVKARQR